MKVSRRPWQLGLELGCEAEPVTAAFANDAADFLIVCPIARPVRREPWSQEPRPSHKKCNAPRPRSNLLYKGSTYSSRLAHSRTYLFLHCTMPAASIAYPPTAHTNHDESSQTPAITNVQPSTGAKMGLASDDNAAQFGKPERLRGGCIPCPV